MSTSSADKIDVILEHVESLHALCDIFFVHNVHTIYWSISGPLRLLLVGSSGDKGLVEDVLPSAAFHRLRVVPDATVAPGHLVLPATARIVRNKSRIQMAAGAKVQTLNVAGGAVSAMSFDELFDLSQPPILFASWIAQPFLWHNRTLGDFIRTVANKDGVAHLGTHNDLLAMKQWGHLHWHLVAHIGRYVLNPLKEQLAAAFPDHVRRVP